MNPPKSRSYLYLVIWNDPFSKEKDEASVFTQEAEAVKFAYTVEGDLYLIGDRLEMVTVLKREGER